MLHQHLHPVHPGDQVHGAAHPLHHLADGVIQLARSPLCATCSPLRVDRSMCPPRIMAKRSAELESLLVGSAVMVCLPALIRSGSSSPSKRKGPSPSMPFSLCNCMAEG